MSNRTGHRRGDRRRTETGPRWESKNPGEGCNSTHVARGRKKWKRRAARSVRRTGDRGKVQPVHLRGRPKPLPVASEAAEASTGRVVPIFLFDVDRKVSREARAIVQRMARAASAATAIEHKILLHVVPAPVVAMPDGGMGFGVTIRTHADAREISIAIGGEAPDGAEDALEEFIVSTFAHELAHYEQIRDGRKVTERGAAVRGRTLQRRIEAAMASEAPSGARKARGR